MFNPLFSKVKRLFFYAAGLILVLISGLASASVVIDTTRVIYPADKSEVSVRLTNEGADPKLVQVWIDAGDRQASPDKIKVPFVILTPIFRMDPKKGQVTRIQYIDNMALPKDKESVFWLNVLEIPAKPNVAAEENYLQFRYRTRIKLFYRPKGLPGTAAEAPGKLIFKYKPGYIQVENPTAYHVSVTGLTVGDKDTGSKADPKMFEPFSTSMLVLKGNGQVLSAPTVVYKAINDFGGSPVRETRAANF